MMWLLSWPLGLCSKLITSLGSPPQGGTRGSEMPSPSSMTESCFITTRSCPRGRATLHLYLKTQPS